LINIGEVTGEKKKEYLSIIKSKSRQLLSLIDDIAELSKFESGQYTINKTETNISKLLNELHLEYTKELTTRNKQNIEIYLKLPTEYNVSTVCTDSGRLQQVMSYLLDNALKYTERGYIQFGYELKDSRHLQFFVKDTGIGIPKEAQKNLFNRFRTKEEVYDKNFQNTGLGLTISRSILELLGGKIQVDSTPGQGSNFSFIIPLQKVDKAGVFDNSKTDGSISNWRNKVILVAEDDEVNYRFIEAIFADSQAQLLHVNDGKQAVELCRTIGKIDLILMDIKMPEKNGYEAVREIKSFRKEIPIIAQTAYTLSEDRAKCIEAGCDDYVSKPIDIELLFSKINKFFNQ
jgi:CheY-like chemotaxis protein